MTTFIIRSSLGLVSILNADEQPPVSVPPPVPSVSAEEGQSPDSAEERQPLTPSAMKRQCFSCGKVFTTSGHLRRHAMIHTGVKGFECPFPDCQKRCSRCDNLIQHYRVHLNNNNRHESNAVVRGFLDRMQAQAYAATAKEQGGGTKRKLDGEETTMPLSAARLPPTPPSLNSSPDAPLMDIGLVK